jgi:hypothetical protein
MAATSGTNHEKKNIMLRIHDVARHALTAFGGYAPRKKIPTFSYSSVNRSLTATR